jgi:chorismate mutase
MVEVHPDPDNAWSDAAQQITPIQFAQMISTLKRRQISSDDPSYLASMDSLRGQIDELDEEIIQLIARRMKLVRDIGYAKKEQKYRHLSAGTLAGTRRGLSSAR